MGGPINDFLFPSRTASSLFSLSLYYPFTLLPFFHFHSLISLRIPGEVIPASTWGVSSLEKLLSRKTYKYNFFITTYKYNLDNFSSSKTFLSLSSSKTFLTFSFRSSFLSFLHKLYQQFFLFSVAFAQLFLQFYLLYFFLRKIYYTFCFYKSYVCKLSI